MMTAANASGPAPTLLRLVCDFVNPIPTDHDGQPEPSLWDQLSAPSKRTGQAGGSKPGSRLPVDAGVLSIVTEVNLWTHHVAPHLVDVPDRMRFIERNVTGRLGDDWSKVLTRWIGEARDILGYTPQRIPLPRGTRCHECDEAWVDVTNDDGETVRQPCVVLVWSAQRDAIDRFTCLACHGEWPACVLPDLAAWPAERERLVRVRQGVSHITR